MQPATAPFHASLAGFDGAAEALWLEAQDGVRLRAVLFRPTVARSGSTTGATPGTVLLFPGRTEYAEKYGHVAQALCAHGHHVLAIDWRGQGLADRLLPDPLIGHVAHFSDYQHDVAALRDAVRTLGLPEPLHMLAHSMGGCIGLRAAMDGLDIASCAFSGPMWGIRISAMMRPAAWAVAWGSRRVGLSHRLAPGTGAASYIAGAEFDDNTLTTDRAMWDYMRAQIDAVPEFGLAGPSMHWLHEALGECRALARRPSPALPCMTWVGGNERIVDVPRIHERMARWPGGSLETVPGAGHEVLMTDENTRTRILEACARHFADSARGLAA
ncbi:alpha/beta fold hydrolase [Citreimonas salinaria]|uniref:Lysophospholipase n=1 Tax=Citreimonas salinaria TaxID=321339 RepID=A0A1H3NPS1_9RHOB|nr:alpha/beta hydrolase [Citreimonas salinaria]SDY90159.1 lysophospholipase [Citreimonas salinaria]